MTISSGYSHLVFKADYLKKNQLYYYRVRATSYNYSTGQYVPVSNWSYGYGINTGVCTVKLSGKKVRIKTPKVKGVKKFTLYMSTNRTKGYKKIKTVKSGKTITVSSFKKKSFKKYKDWLLSPTRWGFFVPVVDTYQNSTVIHEYVAYAPFFL